MARRENEFVSDLFVKLLSEMLALAPHLLDKPLVNPVLTIFVSFPR